MDRRERLLRAGFLWERRRVDADPNLTFFSRSVQLRRLHTRFVMALAELERQRNREGVGNDR